MKEKGLLENINSIVDQDTAKKIENISYESNIYILYLADIHQVTEENLRIGFASYHARYPERTYEDFLRFKKNWDADKYTFDVEPQGYFIDEKTAVEYAESNMGDINEAGAYPYVIVSSMPLNCVYPMCNIRTHRLFHFNDKTEKYEEIGWDYNEGTQFLQRRGDRGAY